MNNNRVLVTGFWIKVVILHTCSWPYGRIIRSILIIFAGAEYDDLDEDTENTDVEILDPHAEQWIGKGKTR